MPTPEANFWNTVRRNLPKNCYPTRIENRHGGGVPDVHFAWLGLVFWIELKTTKNNSVRLSPQQIAWNTAYSRNGGLSFILVKHLPSGDLILFEGAQSLEIGRDGLRSGSLFRGSGHQAMWNQVRESGITHLESVLEQLRGSGVGDSGSGFGGLAQGQLGTGSPVPRSQQPGLEAKEKQA